MSTPSDPRSERDSTDDGSVRLRAVVKADKSTITFVDHWGTAACLCVDQVAGSVLLVRQFRPVLGESLWEIPSGRLEYGESAVHAAARETFEETGHRVGELRQLGRIYPSVGMTNEVIHLFLTTSAIRDPAAAPELQYQWLDIDEALRMFRGPGAVDGKSALALERYREAV